MIVRKAECSCQSQKEEDTYFRELMYAMMAMRQKEQQDALLI